MKTHLFLEALEARELLTQYTFIDLGLRPQDTRSYALGINNEGMAVGNSGDSQGGNAVLFDGETVRQLDGHLPSEARAINDSGWATGYASHFDYGTAFLTDGTHYQTLPSLFGPGSGYCGGSAINNLSQIVGGCGGGVTHAVLWENGTIQDLGYGDALGINNSGWIVGCHLTRGTLTPVLWVNNLVTKLPATGCANAINDAGQVVGDGWLWDQGEVTPLPFRAASVNNNGQIVGGDYTLRGHGAPQIWEAGKSQNLQDLLVDSHGWKLQNATGINDAGQIVGRASNAQGQHHAYRLDPVGNAPFWWAGWALSPRKETPSVC